MQKSEIKKILNSFNLDKRENIIGATLAMGVAFGTVFGTVFNNVGMGLTTGMTIGIIAGVVISQLVHIYIQQE